jgi:osmoprotectant transport system substrate-binding protein
MSAVRPTCCRAYTGRPHGLINPTRRALFTSAFVMPLAVAGPGVAFGQPLVVGAKDFTEQLLIAEMTSQLLTSKGFQVETRSGYDTTRLRQAHQAGVVQICWEYTGTSLRVMNNITAPLTSAETYARVKELDAQKGLVWLKPSQVNNSYALAMRRTDATQKGISTISDLAATVASGERAVFATNPEFYERSDGLRPLEHAYGFQFGRERVIRLDTDMVYQVLRDLKLIDVGLVFATDGRIPAYDLTVLEDDKRFFPDYTMAPVVRKEILEQHPEVAGYVDAISSTLDNETMARLNRMIDVDKRRIAQVASQFLRMHGLLK